MILALSAVFFGVSAASFVAYGRATFAPRRDSRGRFV